VAFVVHNGVKATAGQGDVSSETLVSLAGVNGADFQRIADEAYADLMERLAATGRPVVSLAEITGSKGYAKLATTPASAEAPYVKKAFADSRTFAVFAPAELPLWWVHADAPLGDKGAMDLGNWRALNQLSVDTKAVLIVPQIAIDFAALKGSGHGVIQGNASTSANASLRLLDKTTGFRLFHAKIALAGDLGMAMLKKPLPLADSSGQLVSMKEWGNQDEVAFANSLMANPAMGNVGPGSSYSGQELAYVTEPAAFHDAVMEGIRQVNAMIAAAATDLK
jgi:hypothetical protein